MLFLHAAARYLISKPAKEGVTAKADMKLWFLNYTDFYEDPLAAIEKLQELEENVCFTVGVVSTQ